MTRNKRKYLYMTSCVFKLLANRRMTEIDAGIA